MHRFTKSNIQQPTYKILWSYLVSVTRPLRQFLLENEVTIPSGAKPPAGTISNNTLINNDQYMGTGACRYSDEITLAESDHSTASNNTVTSKLRWH